MNLKYSNDIRPLCVDCDGTLIATDLLHESLTQYLLKYPWRVLSVLRWIIGGRSQLKRELAIRAPISAQTLPYRSEVIDYIRRRREEGGNVYLVTAADSEQARKVARHMGLFDDVYASNDGMNLKGEAKAEYLVARFGEGEFDYIGDSEVDIEIWKRAHLAIVATASEAFVEKVRTINSEVIHLEQRKSNNTKWLRLIRIHQWTKNFIIFLPLIAAHQIFNIHLVALSFAAFVAMCLVASATYIVNDLYDMLYDREHPSKKLRPLANGSVTIPSAVILIGALLLSGAVIASALPVAFQWVVLLYLASTLLYSFWIKKVAVADTVLLASLYTLRIIAGHSVTGIRFSLWLLAFAIFIFFSLALAKRFVELTEELPLGDGGKVKGRGYRAEDIPVVGILGGASGMISVLIIILYINSPDVLLLYRNPMILLLLAPLILYWIGRLWIIAYRSELHYDPVLFALKDRQSYYVALAMALVIVGATISR